MNDLLNTIINWSEAWALLMPLTIVLLYRPSGQGIRLLIIYLCVAFVLNTMAAIMVEFYFSMPSWLKNNNILYNLHSFARVLFFSWYILIIREYRFPVLYKILLAVYLVFLLVNFIFLQSPMLLSARLFTAENILLLILCLSFFLQSMRDESETNWLNHPAFMVCAGISLYEAISFFIFLFFYPLAEKNWDFGDLTMSIHNIIFVILCIILALALYRSRTSKKETK